MFIIMHDEWYGSGSKQRAPTKVCGVKKGKKEEKQKLGGGAK